MRRSEMANGPRCTHRKITEKPAPYKELWSRDSTAGDFQVEKRFQDLPNWTFWIDEVSAGTYRINAKNSKCGSNLELTGADPEELIRRARETASSMEQQTRRKIN